MKSRASHVHGFCYSKASSALRPDAIWEFQSCLHLAMLARIFLSPKRLAIHDMKLSSFSGIKKEERRERTVSKFAELDVMWSIMREDVRL